MKKIQMYITAFSIVLMGALVFVPISNVEAANALDTACEGNSDSALCQDGTKDKSSDSLIATIVNTLLFIVGALSTLMIIVGGIFYVLSQGDSGSVTKAKNTILYSVIGLIVALLAFAIVNFVLDRF